MASRKARLLNVLRDLESSLERMRKITSLSEEDFLRDYRNLYTLRMLIVEVVEAIVDVGLLLVRGEVETYAQVVDRLLEMGVISVGTADSLKSLIRLRNLIVHRYWEVDDLRIYREAKAGGLDSIEGFIREIREAAEDH
ncbi:MAG: DUF86 domain-containing protein [Candidatus Korarchaeota archaeon]|nr:DUF86 domain-containing protein [Candidatus Korarchaeota archaeon]